MATPDEYLFISDCHLDPGKPEISAALKGFLTNRARQARYLYILGDLFEVWLGDDDPAQDYDEIITCLKQLSQSTEIYFMPGNRDFLVGDRLASSAGFERLAEPLELELGDLRVVLMHGDTLCTDDQDYQTFRKLVRDPGWQQDFLNKPLAVRQGIAAELRSASTAAMAGKALEIMDVNSDAVASCFEQHQAQVLIHGHTHRPCHHRYNPAQSRYVLGDWRPEPSYLSWSLEQGFCLVDYRVN